MIKMELNKGKILGMCVAIVIIVVGILFGIIGIRSILGIIIIFCLPLYFIISSFKFSVEESLFFSFFISLGCFSILIYYIN